MINQTDEEVIQLALRIAIAKEEEILKILEGSKCFFTIEDIKTNIQNFKRLQK